MTKQDKDAREQFEIEGEEDPELEEVLRDYDFSKPPLTPEDYARAAAAADKVAEWPSHILRVDVYAREMEKILKDEEEEHIIRNGLKGDELSDFVKKNREEGARYLDILARRYVKLLCGGKSYTAEDLKILRESSQVPAAPYSHVHQERVTNALRRTSSRRMARIPEGSPSAPVKTSGGLSVACGMYHVDDIKVYLSNFDRLKLTPNAQRIKDYALMLLAKKLDYGRPIDEQRGDFNRIQISVREYMELCGLRDYKATYEQLYSGFHELFNVAFEWEGIGSFRRKDPNYGKKIKFHSRFFGSYMEPVPDLARRDPQYCKDGVFTTYVDRVLCEVLLRASLAPFPERLYKVNLHVNPFSYTAGSWLVCYKNENLGTPQEHVISIESLRRALGDLPTDEDVKASRRYNELIRQPLERDLKALRRVSEGGKYRVLEWHYIDEDGNSLTDDAAAALSFRRWAKLRIWFSFIDYPDQTEYIEQKQERKRLRAAGARKAAEKSRKKRTEKKTGTGAAKRGRGRPCKAPGGIDISRALGG